MAGAHDHRGSGPIPFWVHQLVELLLGALLLLQGARTGEHTVALVGFGAALLLLALCSDGALAAWPWIGRRAHRVADFVAAAVLAASPLVLGFTQVLPIVLVELAAATLVWLAFQTNWRRPTRARGLGADEASLPASPVAAPPPARAPEPAPPLPQRLGTAIGRARDDGPRRLGLVVGRARRAARASRRASRTSSCADDSNPQARPTGPSTTADAPPRPPSAGPATPGDPAPGP